MTPPIYHPPIRFLSQPGPYTPKRPVLCIRKIAIHRTKEKIA